MTAPLAAGPPGPALPSLPVLAALIPVLVLVVGLDAGCLVSLVRARSVQHLPKLAWAVVIVCVSAPLGPVLYLCFGVDRSAAGRRTAGLPLPGPAQRPASPPAAAPLPGGPPILTTCGLTRDYGGTGLLGVDLVVPRGCVYGLVGVNGAGKTTLLSILAGTRHAGSGTVALSASRSRVAVCPDVPEFDGWLTAAEVVDLARSLVAPRAGRASVAAALSSAGLADAAGRRVAGFSRGMLQRLGLACALAGDPELLILDEPTSALDPEGRAEMLALVAAMRGTRTVIFSSHILADVQRVADQVGILREGRLVYQGGTRELLDSYLTPRWLLRIAGSAAGVAAELARQPWVSRVEPAAEPGVLAVEAASIEDGERGIPAVVAACGARQVSCEPAAADLEAAFLALTTARAGAAR